MSDSRSGTPVVLVRGAVGDSPRGASTWIWLSIAAAVVTMAIKSVAAALSGSVALLSDALESGVNLVAALVTMGALRWSAAPPDDEHPFGHAKGELLAALFEGFLVFVAGGAIIYTAVQRALHPSPVESVPLGLVLSGVATLVNGVVGVLQVRAGRRLRSSALEADGHHLLTDVWTSVGVIIGLLLVGLTGAQWLDPASAIVVAVLVLRTGYRIVRQALGGLVDSQLPPADAAAITEALAPFLARGVEFAGLRARIAGRAVFVDVTMRVPGEMTVNAAHALADEVEAAVGTKFELSTVMTHVEPRGGAASALEHEGTRPPPAV